VSGSRRVVTGDVLDQRTYHLGVTSPRAAVARIGLSTYREDASWGVWQQPADLLPVTYADSIVAAGGLPVLLPPAAHAGEMELLAEVALDAVHGLLIAGGPDVDPDRYGAERDPNTGPARTGRDGWEIALIRAALRRRMPMLAVCRGMQVLNVALGGTLVQHLPDAVGNTDHCPVVGEHARHDVRIEQASTLGAALGSAALVASYHHQGVDRLGDGLIATAWAEDGVVEAVELPGQPWTVGVQWHPEVYAGGRLFEAFVAACVNARTESADESVPA
jgi:putative glutamine amidotransferase